MRVFESASVHLCHAFGRGCGLLLRCIFLLSLACADVWRSEAGTWLGVWLHLDWRGHISLSAQGREYWAGHPMSPLPSSTSLILDHMDSF